MKDKLRGLLNTTSDSFFWGMDPYIYGLMQARPHPWKRGSLDAFNQSVDSRRQYLQNFRQNNPITASAGEVGGGLLLAGGMGKAMHSMGQDILRKAMGKQPPPVDISRPVHTQQDLVDMSRRRFNQGLLATGAAAGTGGLLVKKAPVIKSAVKSLRPLIPEAVEFAKANKMSPLGIRVFKSLDWNPVKIKKLESVLDTHAVEGDSAKYWEFFNKQSDAFKEAVGNSDAVLKDELAKDFFYPIESPRHDFAYNQRDIDVDPLIKELKKNPKYANNNYTDLEEGVWEFLETMDHYQSNPFYDDVAKAAQRLRDSGHPFPTDTHSHYKAFNEAQDTFSEDVLEYYRRQYGTNK